MIRNYVARQYDLHGEDGSISDVETIKVEELGTVGRLFGALITKAGIPIPTEITPRVLSSAQHISSGVERVSGFELPTVQNLNWGQPVGRSHFKINTISICHFVMRSVLHRGKG